jgi:sulfur carrier protein ThiS adenylyltransferase
MTAVLPQRDARQRDIVPPERLAECQAMVVGVGAIGRQVALQLAAMGVPDLRLIDPDHVEVVNLACQGFLDEDLGRGKVHATAELCRQINPEVQVNTEVARFRRSMDVGNCLFCCVDEIEVRRRIWQAANGRLQFFADGRMSAEVVRVLAVADTESRKHYPTTLFASTEAYQGACTAKSTIFTANIAAGLMLSQFSKWLRHLPIDKDLTLNLLSAELSVG